MVSSEVSTEHIETGVHPAASALALVVNALYRCFHAEVRVVDLKVSVVLCEVVDRVGSHGITHGGVDGGCSRFLDLL